MKRLSLFILVLCSVYTGVIAQNVDDALRYSQFFYGGTARSMSMAGAFTALGGDISTLFQNPAGLGVFRSSEFTLTPQLFHIKTNTNLFNGNGSDYISSFNLGQIGIVGKIISTNNESGLITLNFGYSYNKTNNLNQSVIIEGISNTSSMADYWAGLGNMQGGTLYNQLKGAEGNAFDAWVMDTITGSGGRSYGTVFSNYGDEVNSTYGQTIKRLITNEGYLGEHALSIGGNYSNKLFFGATIGITRLKYTSHYEHFETTGIQNPAQFKDFAYTDHFEDKGTGYSIKIGAIFKPVDAVRIGLAFHSPTWYTIDEYYYNDITSHFTDGAKYEFSTEPSRFNYALATPFRVLAGVGVQIEKIALLSADYEYVDYGSARFSETGDGYDYSEKNNSIKASLKPVSNFRLGGELRLNNLYLRSGFGYYGKAFKSTEDNANLDYSSISFGAGFREQNISIDFGFTNYNYKQKYFLYPVGQDSQGRDIPAAEVGMNTNKNMFTLTLGYKFGI
jgi:hypothetical protein